MKTIVWGNYKGGVGKTTSTYQVASYFAEMGHRVLLLDLDPQCSLSHICSRTMGKTLESFAVDKTFNYLLELYTRLIKKRNDVDLKLLSNNTYNTGFTAIVSEMLQEVRGNLYFIPSSISYAGCRLNDIARKMDAHPDCIFLMKMLLDDIAHIDRVDYVFIDCPPTNNTLIESAFLSSDYYIVPTIIDEISANGVSDYVSEIEKTYHKYDTDEAIGSILISKVFPKKTQLIGIFETLYKSRRENARNPKQIRILNATIDAMGVKTLLSDEKNKSLQYVHGYDPNMTEKHIFKAYIPHKDNHSTGDSMPELTSHGLKAEAYREIANNIYEVIKNE